MNLFSTFRQKMFDLFNNTNSPLWNTKLTQLYRTNDEKIFFIIFKITASLS